MQPLSVYFKKIPGKVKVSGIISIVALGVIWFVMPHLNINQAYPFSSITVRMILTVMLLIAWNIKAIIGFIAQHKTQAIPVLKTHATQVTSFFKRSSQVAWHSAKIKTHDTKTKLLHDHKRRRLRRLPWYVVMGAERSGKHTMMKNSGLIFSRPEHFGEVATHYIHQAPDLEWWFSEEAILINALSADTQGNKRGWKQLIKILKRDRKSRPLNGIILNFSLKDLIVYSHQKRQDFIQEMCDYLREIQHQFKVLLPVYIIFTQCDLIEGFMEFFNDLSKDELRQIWGITFPLAQSSDQQAVSQLFTDRYADLVNQLRKRVIWALDTERTERGRELITAFPQQMQLLKKPIHDFITEIFGIMRYHKAIQLRGIYFTSCTQEHGDRIDLLTQAMSQKFKLVPPHHPQVQRMGECYFMQNIFHAIIQPESSVLGFSMRQKRFNRILYKATILGFPLLGATAIAGMHYGYIENVRYLAQVKANIANYDNAIESTSTQNENLINTLPALDALNKAVLLYQNSPDYGIHFLIMTHTLKRDLNEALMRALHAIFLPRVAANIEHNLNQNIQNMNILYATFKGYLAFSSTSTVPAKAVESPMKLQWAKQFIDTPKTETKLRYYLRTAIKQPIEKLPLNVSLIDSTRTKLEKIIPSNRAFGLLKLESKVNNIAPINLHAAVGNSFDHVFQQTDHNLTIPSFYTKSGFEHIFAKHAKQVSQSVARDNQDIGLNSLNGASQTSSAILNAIQKTYNARYLKSWTNNLSALKIKKFNQLSSATDAIGLMSGKNSPIAKLLTLVYENTQNISDGKVQISQSFANINDYSHSILGNNWNTVSKTLVKVRNYLFTLERSANPDQAAFTAAKLAIQSGGNSPIQQLTLEAQQAPEPVKSWLMSIANNTWGVVIQSAHSYMEDMWQQHVIQAYNNGINDRYPLSASTQSQISIANFNAFFGYGGILQTYFNHYLKPFVDTSHTKWTLYTVNNHSIDLPASFIHSFQKAARIENEFFPNHSTKTHFNFSIRPLTLNAAASSIRLKIGDQTLNYSFGPREIKQVSWPLPANDQETAFNITNFKNGSYSKSVSGPWSLFKIFHFGTLKRTHNNGTYRLLINLNNYDATFQITGSNDQNIFTLKNLTGFHLPQHILNQKDSEHNPQEVQL